MANKVLLKKSSVSARVPTTSDLDYGEVAINYTDGKIYYKNSSNAIKHFIDADAVTTAINSIEVLPDQTGNSGKYLTTDGTNASWGDVNITTDATLYQDTYVGDGVTLEFTLPATPLDANSVIVSINGVLQDPSTYSVEGATLSFVDAPSVDDNIDVRVIVAVLVQNQNLTADTESLTTTDSEQTVDTFSKTTYRTAKYIVQAVDSTGVHSTEVLLTHNDSDVFITEYATIYSDTPLMAVTATIDSANVYLKVTPTNANTTIDFARISLIAGILQQTSSGDLMVLSGSEDLSTGSGTEDLNA